MTVSGWRNFCLDGQDVSCVAGDGYLIETPSIRVTTPECDNGDGKHICFTNPILFLICTNVLIFTCKNEGNAHDKARFLY